MKLTRASVADLEAVFSGEPRSVWVCSPWITGDGLALLRAGLRRCDTSLLWSLEVWLRVDETERDAGITDFAAIDAFIEELESAAPDLRVDLFTAPRLHAKAIWTDTGALVGSANLTGKGFGENIEITVRLDRAEAQQLASLRDELRTAMTRVQREDWRRFVRGKPLPATPQTPTKPSSSWEDFHERLLQRREPGGIR